MVTRIKIFLISILLTSICLAGCDSASIQSSKISKEADDFKTTRVLNVINTKSDKIILRIKGTFSLKYSDGDLDIVCATSESTYVKHYVRLNESITYIVEDTTGSTGDLYHTTIEYYPDE